MPTFDLAAGGYAQPVVIVDGSTGATGQSSTNLSTVKLSGTSLFGYLVNGTTLTPQAVAHVVTITGTPV